MDVSRYLEIKPAPRVFFDLLSERRARPRFMIATPDGDWRAVTWGAAGDQIRDIALYLRSEGVCDGARAAIFAPNRVEWMSAALGIQAAGGVMVPVYASNTAEQAAYVVDHSDARVLFVDTPLLLGRVLQAWHLIDRVTRVVLLDDALDVSRVMADLCSRGSPVPDAAEVARRVLTWSEACAVGAARDAEDPGLFERTLHALSLDQNGVMLYTSGTSGDPKGVPLTHRNVGVNGRDWLVCNASLIDEAPVDLLWLPMSHIFGFGEACLGNTLGFLTYLCDPMSVMSRLPEVRPSVFMSVPAIWEKLATAAMKQPDVAAQHAALDALTGGRLRFCLSGGAGLKQQVKTFFHGAGCLIIEGYGLTETSPTLTLNRPDAFRFDSVGKVLPSVALALDEDGEILARGPNVFAGYHKDPEATAACFTPGGWFRTGDVGRFTEDGFLQIVDRKKDILVTAGGKNVPPANIELRFANDPVITFAVVYGDGERYLVGGFWIDPAGAKASLEDRGLEVEIGSPEWDAAVHALVGERVAGVNAELPSYETLKRFRVMKRPLTVETGLLTPTMKVRRKQVWAAFEAEFREMYA